MSHTRIRSIAWRLMVIFSLLVSYLPFAISTEQGHLRLTLSSPNYGNLGFNDPEAPFNITRPGQDARVSFLGTASQVVTLTLNAVGAPAANINVFNPGHGTCKVG